MSTPSTDVILTMRETAQALIDRRSIRDRDALLGHLVVSAVNLVPAATGGGLTRTHERTVSSSHATTELVQKLDDLQNRLQEGPCVSAADHPPDDGFVIACDLDGTDAQRWPRFAPYALEAGVHSMLSTAVVSERGGPRSALNLYSDQPEAFDTTDLVTAGLFATQAGTLLYGADHTAHLTVAVESRDIIGQAKGILMERFTLDEEEAFAMLVESSQNTNMKLVDVARWLAGEAKQRRDSARHQRSDDKT